MIDSVSGPSVSLKEAVVAHKILCNFNICTEVNTPNVAKSGCDFTYFLEDCYVHVTSKAALSSVIL